MKKSLSQKKKVALPLLAFLFLLSLTHFGSVQAYHEIKGAKEKSRSDHQQDIENREQILDWKERPRLMLYNPGEDVHSMTVTQIDLAIRGMMRSLSKDPAECHSCMRSWDSIYNAVLACEVVWFQWTQEVGVDGSYRIFKAIVTAYEQLKLV